jgi:hypothetical protein
MNNDHVAMPAQQPMKQCLYHPKTPPLSVPSDLSIIVIFTSPVSANIVEIADIDEKQSFATHALEAP